jgi:hypothetical protein
MKFKVINQTIYHVSVFSTKIFFADPLALASQTRQRHTAKLILHCRTEGHFLWQFYKLAEKTLRLYLFMLAQCLVGRMLDATSLRAHHLTATTRTKGRVAPVWIQ